MAQVFCRAAWPGVDYISDGTSVLWILGWSDRTRSTADGVAGDVHYRLWDFATNARADADQIDLLERGYSAVAVGEAAYDRARQTHLEFSRKLHAAIVAAATSVEQRDGSQ